MLMIAAQAYAADAFDRLAALISISFR